MPHPLAAYKAGWQPKSYKDTDKPSANANLFASLQRRSI